MGEKGHHINLYYGGDFVQIPNRSLLYLGGRRYRSVKINLDYFSEIQLMDLYQRCRGRGMAVEFFYLEPGHTLETGLRKIVDGWSIIQMQNHHSEQEEIVIYSVKGPAPIAALDKEGKDITMQVLEVDQGQPILHLREQGEPEAEEAVIDGNVDEEIITGDVNGDEEMRVVNEEEEMRAVNEEEEMRDVIEEEEVRDGNESQATETQPQEGLTQENVILAEDQSSPRHEDPFADYEFTFDEQVSDAEIPQEQMHEQVVVDDEQLPAGGVPEGQHHEGEQDVSDGHEADIEDAAEYENLSDLEPCPEMEEEFRQARMNHTSGDPEESPGDNGDGDWEESDVEESPSDADNQSDDPSDWYDDVEGSQEDDIFNERDNSKEHKRKKLSEMRKKRMEQRRKARVADVGGVVGERSRDGTEWYSENEGDENFDVPPESDHEGPKFAIFRDGDSIDDLKFHVGLTFSGVNKYKEVLTDWSVRKGFELDFFKCEKTRVTALCKGDGCGWRIHASVMQDSSQFQVKTLKGQHSCVRKSNNSRANAAYIAKRMEEVVRDHPDLRIGIFCNIAKRLVGVEITYFVGLRAKKLAMEKLRGDDEKQFAILWDYCETVRQKNPGSTIILHRTDDPETPRFDRLYYSLAAMKNGFLDGCRPLIGLDGCFIKTVHGGQLLAAVGKDGNDNLWPIAVAYVKSENSNTWKWFLRTLMTDLGGAEGGRWTFISDRQKGLLDALNEVAPECEHRFCLRHLYQNFSVRWKGQRLKNLFWQAASAANKPEFRDAMDSIKTEDPRHDDGQMTAYDWLIALHPDCWSRAYFRNGCKSDVLVNNLCESFNNMILPAREKPVVDMFEWIRIRVMNRIAVKRQGMSRFQGTICPNVLKKVNRQVELGRNCIPQWAGDMEFEIQMDGDQFVVKLDDRTCTCGLFQLNGYPCCHAAPCITYMRQQVEDYIDACYKKPAYMEAYKHVVHGVPGKKHYIKTAHTPLKGPEYKPKPGRPKKARRKGADERRPPSTRVGLTHTCSRCLQLGHNVKSCTNNPHPNSRFYTVGLTALDTRSRRPTVPSQRGRRRVFNIRREKNAAARRSRAAATAAANNQTTQDQSSTPNPAPSAQPHTPTNAGSSATPSEGVTAHRNEAPPPETAGPSAPRQRRRPWTKRPTEEEAFRNVRGHAQKRRNNVPWRP